MDHRAFKLRIFAAMGLAAGAFALGATFPVSNPDTYGHLAQGRQIAELGHVPLVDLFSFWKPTPQSWHNYEWLSDVIFWTLYAWGGPGLLLSFVILLAGLFGSLLVGAAALRSRDRADVAAWICAAFLLLVLPALRVRLSIRPHMFGYVLSALLLIGLGQLVSNPSLDVRTRTRTRYWITGLTLSHLAWVNLHGSHLLGLVLTGLHLAPAITNPVLRRRIGTLLGLQLIVSCISPFGPSILIDAVEHVVRPEYRHVVSEWSAWSAGYSPYYIATIVIAGLLVAGLAIPMWRGGIQSKAALLTCSLLGVMAARSLRFHVDFLALSAPLIAATVSSLIREDRVRHARTIAFALAGASAIAAVPVAAQLPPHLNIGMGQNEVLLPAASGRFLKRHAPDARVLAAIDDAWYLMFAAPNAKFLVDGRVPFYGAQHVSRMASAFLSPPLLTQVIKQYAVDAVVIEYAAKGQQQAVMALQALPEWHMVWIEDHHVLFVKASPKRQHWLSAYALNILRPAYTPQILTETENAQALAEHELQRLSHDKNSRKYVSWMQALLLMKPLARQGIEAGFRAPRNDQEREQAIKASELLEHIAIDFNYIPMVQAYRAMAALAACNLEQVHDALGDAREQGDNREALLTEIELLLRSGDTHIVKQKLEQARQFPQAATDPWLSAIQDDLLAHVACP